MDFDVEVIVNQDLEQVKNTGVSIARGDSVEPYNVDANVYLSTEEVRELVKGERLHTEQRKNILNIFPPSKTFEDEEEWGHYDDVLVALEEIYTFIEKIESIAPGLLRFTEKEKLKNTYIHYKKQQDRYQQTNK